MANTAASISRDDMLPITSVEGLCKLLARLGYEVDALPYEPETLGLGSMETIRGMHRLSTVGQTLHIYGFVLSDLDAATVRAVATRLQSYYPQLMLLLVFASETWSQLAVANVRKVYQRDGKVTVKVHRVTVDRTRPTRHELDLLSKLARVSDSPTEVFAAHCGAFDVEKVANLSRA